MDATNVAYVKVFHDNKGNRLVFPAYIYTSLGDDDVPSATDFWSIGMNMRLATGLDMEDEWMVVDLNAFPHLETAVAHSGFLHGRADAYLFAGPVFDETMKGMAA